MPKLAKVSELLSAIPAERALDWAARMIAPNFRGRDAARAHEVLTARAHFTHGPADEKALDLIMSRQRQLFAPHILMYLGRIAVLHGSDRPAGDHENPQDVKRYERILLQAMLIAAHYAGSRSRTDRPGAGKDGPRPSKSRDMIKDQPQSQRPAPAAPGGTSTGHEAAARRASEAEIVKAMDLELAANIMANRKPFAASSFHRSERRWIELPAAHPDPDAVDLAAEYEIATGAKLSDLRMVGAVLWARTAAGGKPHIGMNTSPGWAWVPTALRQSYG